MEFTTKHIGAYSGRPAKIIELTINAFGTTLTQDITDLKSKVDENLILSLRQLADELEDHNKAVNELLNQ